MHHYTWPSTLLQSGWGGWGRLRESGRDGYVQLTEGRGTRWWSSCYAKNQVDQNTHALTLTHSVMCAKSTRKEEAGGRAVSERCHWGWPQHTNNSDTRTRHTSTTGDGDGDHKNKMFSTSNPDLSPFFSLSMSTSSNVSPELQLLGFFIDQSRYFMLTAMHRLREEGFSEFPQS